MPDAPSGLEMKRMKTFRLSNLPPNHPERELELVVERRSSLQRRSRMLKLVSHLLNHLLSKWRSIKLKSIQSVRVKRNWSSPPKLVHPSRNHPEM